MRSGGRKSQALSRRGGCRSVLTLALPMSDSSLKLEWCLRPGGGGKTQREYLNFLISGKPLLQVLGAPKSDFIGRLGWGPPADYKNGIDHLLLKLPPDSPSASSDLSGMR